MMSFLYLTTKRVITELKNQHRTSDMYIFVVRNSILFVCVALCEKT